jgi:hypothetical protein
LPWSPLGGEIAKKKQAENRFQVTAACEAEICYW